MKDVIIMPTYNERINVSSVIPQIFQIIPDINIFIVDDSSPDGTAKEVKALMNKFSNLSIKIRKNKDGYGEAMKDAILEKIKDNEVRSIITMDADGSHDPVYLPAIVEAIKKNDLVIGSRYVKGGGVENWKVWRKYLSKYGNIYTRMLTGLVIHDCTAGFNCFRREILLNIDFSKINSNGYSFLIELKYNLVKMTKNIRIKEVPIIFKERRVGVSKISKQIIFEGIKTPIKILASRLFKAYD
jgi:dolichol-phosphate mannosyltransferase